MRFVIWNYSRQRRDLTNSFRVKGTKWCGKGWSATKYADLGGYSKSDRCCRQHDKACPFWIMGFETKYGLFNWRINTIMHCSCDERYLYRLYSFWFIIVRLPWWSHKKCESVRDSTRMERWCICRCVDSECVSIRNKRF